MIDAKGEAFSFFALSQEILSVDCVYFHPQEEDFASEDEYNDYLEEMECIVYNLCNNIDIINTNKKIEQYKKDNRDTIMKNKSRLGREEYELELELEREKQVEADRKKELQQIEQVNWIVRVHSVVVTESLFYF